MNRTRPVLVLFLLALPTAGAAQEGAQPQTLTLGGFSFEQSVTVPGTPEEVFDGFTGDVLPWWDHHFKGKPLRLHIEPRVGGCFCEVFDSAGNGARHAVVTYAERGKMLRFEGPLGLTGFAFNMVHTFEFTQRGDSTQLTLKLRGAGEMQESWPRVVNRVWHHFLVERFKPWWERTRGRRS